eukprot:scaffold3285_cov140-Amphora_coffeaeformis.AAC.3
MPPPLLTIRKSRLFQSLFSTHHQQTTMKLSIAVVTALFSSVAKATNLRKSVADKDATHDGEESFGARIHVGGLVGVPTKGELAILDQVVMDAYNSAHENIDVEMGSMLSQVAIPRNDGVMILSEFVSYSGGGYCYLCKSLSCFTLVCVRAVLRDDGHDDFVCYLNPACRGLGAEVDFLTAKTAKVHMTFENRMCKKLRSSGIAVFAQAKDCSFDILENPGSFSTRLSEKVVYDAQDARPTDVELSMVGVNKDLAADEVKFMESTVRDTHNDLLGKFGYGLTKFDAVSFVSVEGSFLVSGTVVPVVHKGEHNPEPSVAASMHQAFETAFCDKLKNSGMPVFAGVHDCAFNFVYNPVKEMTTKKGASVAALA